MKRNGHSGFYAFIKYVLIFGLAAQIACSGTKAQKSDPPKEVSTAANKAETRNNAASLLKDLLNQEKNADKILIIKHNSPELGHLMKAISKTAGDGEDELVALAKDDKTLNLHAVQLPPGEVATRAAITKTKEHEMLFSSGETFELDLLLSQTDALDYGSHLAKIAAENAATPEQERRFHSLDVQLSDLFKRTADRIRALPRK